MKETDSDAGAVEIWKDGVKVPRATGRYHKNKYKEDFPERFIELCRIGGSVPEFCLEVGIAKDTFYEYCKMYPDMAMARKIGKALAEGWWMSQARDNLVTYHSKEEGGSRFAQKLYEWTMGGRFGQTADRGQRLLIEELLRRTANLAGNVDSVIAGEPEYEKLKEVVDQALEKFKDDGF